jgi:hypothetical protein
MSQAALRDDAHMTESRSDADRSARLSDALSSAVIGDPRAMAVVVAADHQALRDSAPSRLVVSRAAAVAVLVGLNQGTITPVEAQQWASFVRWGFVAGNSGPAMPLDIDYEDAWEDAIVEAVGRLDQIGDLVDGEVTRGEVLDLLQLLGVA